MKDQYKYLVESWCKVHDLPLPIFEFRFDKERKYRADLAWPMRDLLVEVQGGAWVYGRHNRASGYVKDLERSNCIAMNGYYLLQFTPQEVRNGKAFEQIKAFFERGKEVDHE